jgi:DNA (cytosine-5)-methyltransferase 1
MRYLSVCSGIEAATVAWHPLGWTPAGFAEIEPFPRAVLEQRHGAVAVDWDHRWQEGQNFAPMFGDFTKIGPEHVGPVDLLVGGTPCQSFSIAGKRLGLDDPRGNLAIEFLALAKRISARWLVWENVPGVYSSWSGEPDNEATAEWTETADFAEFLNLFRECGYRGAWRTVDAQYVRVDGFGRAVPQRRRRCFLVGHSGNDTRAIPVLFDPESLRGFAEPRRTTGQGVAAAFGSDPEGDCQPFTLAERGRSDGPSLEWRQDGTSNAILTPGGGRSGLGVASIACKVECDPVANTLQTTCHDYSRADGFNMIAEFDPNAGRPAGTVSAKWAKGSGGPSGDECQNLVAVPFDTTQITSRTNFSNPQPDDPCHPLAAGAHPPHVAYAIQERAVSENPAAGPQGKGWQEDVAFTLEARRGGQAVAFAETSNTLSASTGGVSGKDAIDARLVAVPFSGDVAPTVTSNGDQHSGFRHGGGHVAIPEGHAPFDVPTVNGWTVRKLTPRECERLQGFPDDFTAIQWRGKSAPDGPRYKAIGNSMAVNVMRWIGARIALVEQAVEEAAGSGRI